MAVIAPLLGAGFAAGLLLFNLAARGITHEHP